MSSESSGSGQVRSTLDILVFTVGGVHCGIDGELIGRMLLPEEAEYGKVAVRWFHQALTFGDREVVYQNPRVITFNRAGAAAGLVIDQPRDLIRVPVGSIRPLPAFFALTPGLRPLWGAFVLEEQVVLLVEPQRLLA
jgi:hypothetical protein